MKFIHVRHFPLRHALFLLCLLGLLSACSSTKHVPEGEALFWKYEVKVDGNTSKDEISKLSTDLDGVVRPKPNAKLLGIPFKLWIYNAFYTEKEKGIKHWVQTKMGEPPVLLSQLDTGTVNSIMRGRLDNNGYFNKAVASTFDTVATKKMAVNWHVNVGEPYRIRRIEFPATDSVQAATAIRKTQDGSLLKVGDIYNLQTLTAERERIDDLLKNKGYFNFSPDLMIFQVDSTVGNHQLDVLLRLKKTAPAAALHPYTMDDIYVFTGYSLADSLYANDTIHFKGYDYIPNENYIKAKRLMPNIFLEKDSLYSRQEQLLSLQRLMGLSAFKYANIDYDVDTLNPDKLDAHIYLTQSFKKSLQAEAQGVSKTNGFAGPGITASFRNRNALKGSELLTLSLTGSFLSGGNSGTSLNSVELGAEAALTFPRFVAPFKIHNLRSQFAPHTTMTLGFDYQNRVNFFQLNSFHATYGYNWRPRPTITHEVTPINLQFVQLANTSDKFKALLDSSEFLQRSFEEQFIIGTMYNLTWNTQIYEQRTHQFFNNVNIDLSGNAINALQSLTGQSSPTDSVGRTLFGKAYSQYTRVENDFRYYFNFGKESQLVTRLLAGVGFAYGNSNTMPYVKQFTIGGPNSIRAFQPRSIGPGSYNVPDSIQTSYFDQTGDIRLEANVEYRFPITGFFKGALFVDAGNIWLLRETAEKPGAAFKASNLMDQLAIGTGFGVRVDIEFFVIRFDLGIPVQVPYLPKGERNVLSDFTPSFKGETGMTLNIAIGYPF
ncbi:BamA/TamA family outer membrane protein [Pontibacter liquoris]|uniref:translocation and assembly module lipoprotein TamL n=1 Tax=Pontibacter liquoris TaxID=2905677 RepID=UPI001FA72DB6|nr:BamA/TamA family outer membrane protein [Pontibacter liquoris]